MDVLEEVLEDPENQEHLRTALTKLLKDEPISFYKHIAMPRLQQLAKKATEAAKTARTAAEAEIERQLMEEASGAATQELEEFLHGKPNVTKAPVVSNM